VVRRSASDAAVEEAIMMFYFAAHRNRRASLGNYPNECLFAAAAMAVDGNELSRDWFWCRWDGIQSYGSRSPHARCQDRLRQMHPGCNPVRIQEMSERHIGIFLRNRMLIGAYPGDDALRFANYFLRLTHDIDLLRQGLRHELETQLLIRNLAGEIVGENHLGLPVLRPEYSSPFLKPVTLEDFALFVGKKTK